MTTPSISKRSYIRWIPGIATEPTSTLVLSSHTRRYIDVRIFLPSSSLDEIPLPNTGGPLSRLDWAFAGISSTTTPSSPSPSATTSTPTSSPNKTPQKMNQTSTTGSPASKFPGSPHSGIGLQSPLPPMHSVWDHWVDSRTPNPAKDEGDLWPQPSGSILEKGEMINPHTGKLTEYEELWADEEPQATGYDCQRVSAVLVMECESNAGAPGTRGMVIRVGQWCQGIMVGGGEAENGGGRAVDIERWTWVPSALEPAVAPDGEGGTEGSREPEREEAKRDGDWERIAKIGSRFLPCSLLFDAGEAGNVEEGNVVEAGEATWKVVEKYLW